jgi:hypothetical protein
MDWNAAIEKNREALKGVLAMLVGMAALPVLRACGDVGISGGGGFFDLRACGVAATLPRHLHRAVLRLLRPAEAAARRLIIVAARGIVVALPPARPYKPKPTAILRNGVGTGIVMPRNVPHPEVRGEAEPRRRLCLPLSIRCPVGAAASGRPQAGFRASAFRV